MGLGSRSLLYYAIVILVIVDMAVAVYAVFEGPFPSRVTLGTPIAYKNIYLHVPIAVSTYVLFAGALLASILYLWRGDRRLVAYVDSFVTYGILFGAATLVTGSAWASESWGTAWNWDPKETAVLLLFISYLMYYPLKRSISDPERRDRIGAVYAIAAFTMVPLSFLASRIIESLHPTTGAVSSFTQGGIGGAILGVRILLVMSVGVMLALARVKGVSLPRQLASIVVVVGVLVALYVAYPIVGGDSYRVLGATVDDNGYIYSIELSNGRVIWFDKPVPPPIEPPLTADGVSTLVTHIVKINDGSIEVLYHWSTPFALTIYSLLLSIGIIVVGRRGEGG